MHKNLSSSEPFWAAEINHEICQTNLDELKSWVVSGRLKPTDRVRMKNLNWIEAQKVPAFSKLFDANNDKNVSVNSAPSPNSTSTVDPVPVSVPDSFNSVPLSAPDSFNASLADGTGAQPEPVVEKNEFVIPTEKELPPLLLFDSQTVEEVEKIKATPAAKPVEVSSLPLQINIEEKVLVKPLPAKTKPKDKTQFTESTVLCQTCFYFCRYIPRAIDGLPFSCPVCYSDCIFIEPAKGQLMKTQVLDSKKTNVPFPELVDGIIPTLKKKNRVRGFVFGSLLMAALAAGGSYLWVYQLRAPIENDEQTNQELVGLQEKFTADKISVSVRFADLEQLPKPADGQENPAPNADISQELARLQKQYEFDRKNITDNYQNKKAQSDFAQIAVISFIALLVLYILKKLLLG